MPDLRDLRPAPDRRERLRRTVRRVVLSRRRPLAAMCAGLTVLGVARAVQPAPGPSVPVTVAARDLASGVVLTPRDVAVRRYPAGDAPAGVETSAVGRTLGAPVRRGEPITDVRLVTPSLLAGYPGLVAVPVRIADADAVSLLRVGDHIDLVAADPRRGTASYVATDMPVVSLPAASGPGDEGTSTLSPGRLVVVAASSTDVARIAGAAGGGLLSLDISR